MVWIQDRAENKMNKKALSGIVVTLLIILLAIVSISILSINVNKFIKSSVNLSPRISCLEMQSSNAIKIESSCLNSETNEIELTLKRSVSDFEISRLDFTLSSNTESSSWCCGSPDCPYCSVLKDGESKKYLFFLDEEESPNSAIVSIDACELDKKIISQC